MRDAANGKRKATLVDSRGTGAGAGVAFSPDGTILAAGDDNGGIYLWNVKTHQLAVSNPLYDPGGDGIYGIAFSPRGYLLAAADGNGKIYLWNAQTGKPAEAPLIDPDGATIQGGVVFSRDGSLIAAGGSTAMFTSGT